jgi:LmbE family N-acetylglucosaminyl deacetylase
LNVNTVFFGKILFLVPHMDDEILACGGTIAQIINKELVYVVFITDSRGLADHNAAPKVDLNKIRSSESKAALGVLGIKGKNIKFLDFPDRYLKQYYNLLVVKLQEIINDIKPDHIFIPFRYDWHPDHITLNKASKSACAGVKFKISLIEYFVYTKWHLLKKRDIREYINPELLITVDISSVKDLKKKALECFKSQTTNYFEKQLRPTLTREFLEGNYNSPEIFLKTNKYLETFYFGSQTWISIDSLIEPVLKNRKERILYSLYRLKKNFIFQGNNIK